MPDNYQVESDARTLMQANKIRQDRERTALQQWQEGLRLLRVAYRWPRKPDHLYELRDRATISVRALRRVEQDLHELWWNQARRGYLRAELRRRALANLWRAVCLCIQSFATQLERNRAQLSATARLQALVWSAGVLAISSALAASGDWKPSKPIEFVVPAPAGGTLDRPARLVQKIWQEAKLIDVPVNIVNKSGGGQSVGYTYVQQAANDPHRLLLVSGPLLSNHITGRNKLNYTDFSILGQLYTEYNVISVRGDSAIKTTSDLIARLKPAPDSLSVAIGTAPGNGSHIAIALPFKRAGVDIKRLRMVVFPSAGESVSNLLGGHVDYVTGGLSVASPHWKAGKIRILVVSAPKRLEGEYAQIPTWIEQGIDAVVSNSRFVMAPPGLTAAQIAYWDGILRRTTASAEWKKMVAQEQWVGEFVSSAGARKHLDQEYAETREILTDLGMAKPP